MDTNRLGRIAVPTLVAFVVGMLPAPRTTAATVSSGAIFNNPTGTRDQQYAIHQHEVNLIQKAAPDSEIRVAMFHFGSVWMANELVAAATDPSRRIHVQVVVDHESVAGSGSAWDVLQRGLGTDTSKPSWVMNCTPGAACIGNDDPWDHHPINHNKFFLFSKVEDSPDVVVQTSSNQTRASREDQWNNAVTVAGNTALYDAYMSYFNDLSQMRKTNNYYRSSVAGAYEAYFFPRHQRSGQPAADPATDTVVSILDSVRCTGGTAVRLGMNLFSRVEVAKKLKQLSGQGCHVEVVYAELAAKARDALQGIPVLQGCNDEQGGRNVLVHSKYMLIDGYYGDGPHKLVFTGSHNYTLSALRANDELLLKIDDPTIYGQFRTNFDDLRTNCRGGKIT